MLKYKGLYSHDKRESCYVIGYLDDIHRLVSIWWIQSYKDKDNTSQRIWESFKGSNAEKTSYANLKFRAYV